MLTPRRKEQGPSGDNDNAGHENNCMIFPSNSIHEPLCLPGRRTQQMQRRSVVLAPRREHFTRNRKGGFQRQCKSADRTVHSWHKPRNRKKTPLPGTDSRNKEEVEQDCVAVSIVDVPVGLSNNLAVVPETATTTLWCQSFNETAAGTTM